MFRNRLPLSRLHLHTTPKFTLKGRKYKCQIVSVIDGDTVRVAFQPFWRSGVFTFSVRLVNFDTPEIRTTDPDEKIRGLLAKSHLINYLDQHQVCYLVCEDFDSFGRVLGHLYIDKKLRVCVNDHMIQFLQHQQWD